ncbi:hypothetical protein BO82DRAFT_358055 [Aspergillus uvarum CBS 121591]|uniref:Uncharacterized protein n=1 Tax=Aspergillus uvarum CBS 121591 TaxID=1448315 RepID=A0A319C027_9EURO|nr:hypothetical protein BO82DRAFT_358055 [Aspergillus uvarum CBS 121591]PYH77681.1 hypothetical protein BO82DRAFT_358055 [Aspergillus uvarum CBS 121591]
MPPLHPTTTTTTTSSFTLNNTLTSIPHPDKHLTPTSKRNPPLLRRKSTIHHLRHWLSQHLPTNPSSPSPGAPGSPSKRLRKPTYHRSPPPPPPQPREQHQHCNPDSKSETDTFSTTISTSSSRSSSPTPSTEHLGVEYEAYCRAFSSGLTAESYAYADPHHHPLASDYRGDQHYPHAEAPAAAAAATITTITTTRQPTRSTTTTPGTRPSRRRRGRPWRIDEIRRPEDVRMLSGGQALHHHHHHQYERDYPDPRDHHPPDRHDRPDYRDSEAEPEGGLIDPPHDLTTATTTNITPNTDNHSHIINPEKSKDIEQFSNITTTTTKKSDNAPEPNHKTTTTNTTTPNPEEEQAPIFPPTPIITPNTQFQTQEILHWLRHRSSLDSIDRQAFEQHRYLHEGGDHPDTDADADTDADTDADNNTNTDRQTHAAAAHWHRHPPRRSPPLRVLTPARYEQLRKHATPQPPRKPWWGTVQSYWARMRPRSEAARREARREKQEADW